MAKRGKKNRRGDWEFNHYQIRKAFIEYLKQNKRRPTIKELAEVTGLHRRTIETHLEKLEFTPQEHPGRIMTDDVLTAILTKALSADTPAARLWLQVAEGWSVKKEPKKSNDGELLLEASGSKVRIYIPDNGRGDRGA